MIYEVKIEKTFLNPQNIERRAKPSFKIKGVSMAGDTITLYIETSSEIKPEHLNSILALLNQNRWEVTKVKKGSLPRDIQILKEMK